MCLPCCSEDSAKSQWSTAATIAVASITLLVLNCLAVNYHLSSVSIGVINTLTFSAVAIPAAIILIKNFDHLDFKERVIALTVFVFFATLAALSALGIAKIFSAPSVGWTFLAPLISLIGVGVIGGAVRCYLKRNDDLDTFSDPFNLRAKFFDS